MRCFDPSVTTSTFGIADAGPGCGVALIPGDVHPVASLMQRVDDLCVGPGASVDRHFVSVGSAHTFSRSESAVKRHMKELIDAGLVVSRPQWTNGDGEYSTIKNQGWRQTASLYELPQHFDRGFNNDPPSTPEPQGRINSEPGVGFNNDLQYESPYTPDKKSPKAHNSTSELCSDATHFTSNSQANVTREDILPKDHWKHLRGKLQEVGKAIQQTGDFHSELAQQEWEGFIFSLELVTDHLPYSWAIVDLTQNGKWTVSKKVAAEYEAGKELLTLLNTAKAAA